MSNEGKGHLWKRCPYSTASTVHGDTRIPVGEKTDHLVSEGRMVADGRGYAVGYECWDDDNCAFFQGTATTPITRVKHVCGTNTVVTGTVNIIQGTRYLEV